MMTSVSQREEANTEVIQLVNDVRKYEAVKLDERTLGRKGWGRTLVEVPPEVPPTFNRYLTKARTSYRYLASSVKKKIITLMKM
jgi:hypothetical protein